MRVTSLLAVVTLAIAFSVMLTALAAADGPRGWSDEVPGPERGPSGQTGQLTWLENPARPYAGGAEQVGPYRLLPPGTLYIERTYPGDTGARDFAETSSPDVLRRSALYFEPLPGFSVSSERGTVRDGQVIGIDSYWKNDAGDALIVSSAAVPDWMLPLDVYLYPTDSPLEVFTTTIAGRPAIVEQPSAGPAPNVGYVRVWLEGQEIVLRSPSMGQDRLIDLAARLVGGE
ncbi:hypothetical protein A9A59_1349 [Tepidiforma thermophila]|jgi:hypothetical protein|uniref:DUF4367 domain-containing protein n=1 Tax=Tepidiforma thermophila (strain KCTC 52669 / CGMCC 1.13589 / G233) TaxID=2761530 RepID=A0A2A9HGC0_TEPT2|nr:hypothetical protein A9A59_1349 [Tepidiforma thermophila]